MHSFFFGDSKKPLYGVIHHPEGEHFRNSAILICNSVGHEYIRCHRELRRLADKLAAAGYYVLRFDFSGVGDSAGNFEDFDLSHWQDDIQLACEELKAVSGQQQIDCVGVRLGATVAFNAVPVAGFGKLVLWDPVVYGKQCFTDPLNQLQDELLQSNMWFTSPRDRSELPDNEFLSYNYSIKLLAQLESEDLFETALDEYVQYTYLYTNKNVSSEAFSKKIMTAKDNAAQWVSDIGGWDKLEHVDASMSANQLLNCIVREFG